MGRWVHGGLGSATAGARPVRDHGDHRPRRGRVRGVLRAGRPRRRDPDHPGDPVRAGVGDQDVHRGHGRGSRRGLRRTGGLAAAAGAAPVDAASRRHRAPPAQPHLADRRLRRGGGPGPGRVRDAVDGPALLPVRAPGRLPAAVRRPPAVRAARRRVPLLQRRLRAARADRRGGLRAVLCGRRPAAGVRAGRDGGERVLPAGRAGARPRGRLPRRPDGPMCTRSR